MRYLLLILLLGLGLGCNKKDVIPNTCGVKRPLKDLSWLKAKTQAVESISQARYQDQTVYVTATSSRGIAGALVTIYSCDGTKLCDFMLVRIHNQPGLCEIYSQLTDEKVIFEQNLYNW
ncbi:hypothetical protein [Siphonobacter sp. SORGH_AS_1065]|uniref:hypothetical protein n=1 Tax=Siphonobacter sp. SORGH_AS_1065 TaxID=3041795 RepID=UPI0027821053|nr:hypothetical protein [Siphonobacter sp. SORGH_AS_1065]MDQ1087763.1 hypothetical protein [Siphonobacter sp. SORGH_AS_1065]